MAIGVDTTKWKPRKLKGTPAVLFGNIVAMSIIGFGIASGLIFHLSSVTQNLKKATEGLYEDPIEEVERRLLIASGLPTYTGKQMRDIVEEDNRIDQPYN